VNRLVVRLVLTHLLVAVVAAAATFLVVRQLAPALFDQTLRMGSGPGSPMGTGPGQQGVLRQQFADAVDASLGWGALVGGLVAAVVGSVAAYRLSRPIEAVRAATRAIAQGRYAVPLPTPRTTELAELSADVQRLGHELADTESRRMRLLGDVAHELRTPLTIIDGTVEAMIDGVVPADAEHLGPISAEVRRMRRLSEDLSALSRADEGRLALRPQHIDLGTVVEGVVDRLRPQAQDADLDVTVVPSAHLIAVDADPDRIGQIITNVLGNAIRATPAGGSIELGWHVARGLAVVTVRDTGEGLAPTELERIFERFYRVADRAADHEGGSGIGLTIARGLARAHGGDLVAGSAGAGQGATFTLTLPLAP